MTTQRPAVAHQAGQLDSGFGKEGIVFPTISNPGKHTIGAIATSPEGQLYFTGWSDSGPLFLGRLNSDGSPDFTFNGTGIVYGQGHAHSEGYSLAFLQGGRVLVIADVDDIAGMRRSAVFCFTPDGKPDAGFGTDGVVVIDIASGSVSGSEHPSAALHADVLTEDKILLTSKSPGFAWIVVLLGDGSFDDSFNRTGYVNVRHPDYPPEAIQLTSTMIEEDGKYLGCGALWNNNGQDRHKALFVRYLKNGNIDGTFGKAGFVIITAEPELEGVRIHHMAAQHNQRILGVGTNLRRPVSALLTSLEPDGLANIQFNNGLPLYTRLDNSEITAWKGVAQQADGKIVVAGEVAESNDVVSIVVARFLSNGTFDESFNQGRGYVLTPLDEKWAAGTAMTLQHDGKIVVAAFTKVGNAIVPVILRYWHTTSDAPSTPGLPDATSIPSSAPAHTNYLDPSFGQDGKVYLDFNGTTEGAIQAGALQPDQKIVVACNVGVGFGLARFNPDGSLDTGFGNGGRATGEFNPQELGMTVTGLHIFDDGKILLTAEQSDGEGLVPAVAKFNSDGSPDVEFGNKGQTIVSLIPPGQSHSLKGECGKSAVLPGGKILLTFNTSLSDAYTSGALLIRLNPNGTLDTRFNGGGTLALRYSDTALSKLLGVTVQTDGHYVVTGREHDIPRFSFLAKVDEDANIDPTFGTKGYAPVQIAGKTTLLSMTTIGPGTSFVSVGGLSEGPHAGRGIVSKITNTGHSDSQFNSGEPALLSASQRTVILRDAIATDRYITVAGDGSSPEGQRSTLARYLHNGDLDQSFPGNGVILDSPLRSIFALLPQADGKFIAVGDIDNTLAMCRVLA